MKLELQITEKGNEFYNQDPLKVDLLPVMPRFY